MGTKLKFILIITSLFVIGSSTIIYYTYKHKTADTPPDIFDQPSLEYTTLYYDSSSCDSTIISDYRHYIHYVNSYDFIQMQKDNPYEFSIDKYDEDFFENNSIAILQISLGCGLDKIEKIHLSTEDNTLICRVRVKYQSGRVTCDMGGRLILVEIDKSITDFKIEKN